MSGYVGYVYLTTNTITGKKYVGQHKWGNHPHIDPNYFGSGMMMQREIEAYGKAAFVCRILGWARTEAALNEYEMSYIEKYNTLHPNGLNLKYDENHAERYNPNRAVSKENNSNSKESGIVYAIFQAILYYGSIIALIATRGTERDLFFTVLPIVVLTIITNLIVSLFNIPTVFKILITLFLPIALVLLFVLMVVGDTGKSKRRR
ncbi:MAG: hypothetical protein LBS91_08060 [Clostridiales Family XIII bacterium]|jgi:hypothetical protein|nr:hypothetical protein [Clostridiales Family XIII bacterium]